jgi:hypothetical protein
MPSIRPGVRFSVNDNPSKPLRRCPWAAVRMRSLTSRPRLHARSPSPTAEMRGLPNPTASRLARRLRQHSEGAWGTPARAPARGRGAGQEPGVGGDGAEPVARGLHAGSGAVGACRPLSDGRRQDRAGGGVLVGRSPGWARGAALRSQRQEAGGGAGCPCLCRTQLSLPHPDGSEACGSLLAPQTKPERAQKLQRPFNQGRCCVIPHGHLAGVRVRA